MYVPTVSILLRNIGLYNEQAKPGHLIPKTQLIYLSNRRHDPCRNNEHLIQRFILAPTNSSSTIRYIKNNNQKSFWFALKNYVIIHVVKTELSVCYSPHWLNFTFSLETNFYSTMTALMQTRKPGSCNSTLFSLIGINSSTNGRYGIRARHSETLNIQMTKVKLVKQLPPLEKRLFKIVPRSSLGKYPGIEVGKSCQLPLETTAVWLNSWVLVLNNLIFWLLS